MSDLKKKTLTGFAWNTVQNTANIGVSFLFMIFLTRLLTPSDYGMVGMLAVFMAIANTFIDCGFGQAIVRKQNRTHVDESTVFFFNIAASVACYVVLFVIAPFVGSFYNMPELSPILRVLGLSLIISSFSTVQTLIYKIKLNFKVPSLVNLGSSIFAGCGALFLAYRGWGVWALVTQRLLACFFTSVTYWIVSSWRPLLEWSKQSFNEMFSFGSKLLGAQLLNNIYHNLSSIVIGKSYSSADLGLYTKGEQITSIGPSIITGAVCQVTYPVLCTFQNDHGVLSEVYSKMIRMLSFSIFPMVTILMISANPLITVVFGEKWTPSAEYVSLLCYPWAMAMIVTLNLNLMQVIGRSDTVLRVGIYGKIIGVTMLAITLPISIKALCIGTIFTTTISFFINTYYTSRYISITIKEQFVDIIRSVALCFVMGVVLFFSMRMTNSNLIKIIVSIVEGPIVYLGLAYILRMKEFSDLVGLIKTRHL